MFQLDGGVESGESSLDRRTIVRASNLVKLFQDIHFLYKFSQLIGQDGGSAVELCLCRCHTHILHEYAEIANPNLERARPRRLPTPGVLSVPSTQESDH